MPGSGLGSFAHPEATMFGIASIAAFIVALILLCLAVHVVAPGWPRRSA